MNIEEYDKLWLEQISSFDHSGGLAEYWSGRAGTYDSVYRTGTYSVELVKRMELLPGYSVLDIACGTGGTTIPLAKKVRSVTALDVSLRMLEILNKRAADAQLDNITVVNKDWDRVDIGKDIERHDVVLISRSLPGIRLSESLKKFDLSASRACYLTWRAQRSDNYEVAVSKVLGKHRHEYPEYNVIYQTLLCLGIPAKTEIFESVNEEKFPSLDEAVLNMSRGAALSGSQIKNLHDLARSRLSYENGFYCSRYKMKWALISWRKE